MDGPVTRFRDLDKIRIYSSILELIPNLTSQIQSIFLHGALGYLQIVGISLDYLHAYITKSYQH